MEPLFLTDLSGQRFAVALELFRSGRAFYYERVCFSLSPEGLVHCEVQSSWNPENVTELSARRDLERGERVLESVAATSQEFAAIIANRRHLFRLVHDHGKGSIELASLERGKVHWSPGFEPRVPLSDEEL